MSQVSQFEDYIKGQKEHVDRRNMAMKLATNREFKKLILEEFCIHECARYAQNSGNPALSEQDRADSLMFAQAAGVLRRWLQVIARMGDQAESNISQAEEELSELRAEEDAEVEPDFDDGEDEGTEFAE